MFTTHSHSVQCDAPHRFLISVMGHLILLMTCSVNGSQFDSSACMSCCCQCAVLVVSGCGGWQWFQSLLSPSNSQSFALSRFLLYPHFLSSFSFASGLLSNEWCPVCDVQCASVQWTRQMTVTFSHSQKEQFHALHGIFRQQQQQQKHWWNCSAQRELNRHYHWKEKTLHWHRLLDIDTITTLALYFVVVISSVCVVHRSDQWQWYTTTLY